MGKRKERKDSEIRGRCDTNRKICAFYISEDDVGKAESSRK